jgi:class 3 adenylate cyclase/tetratricopeptide (TPR) repeat protein
MSCPKCQHVSRDGAKFCEECGAPIGRTCPVCSHPVLNTAKYCAECGHGLEPAKEDKTVRRFSTPAHYTPKHLAEKILVSKDTLEGERKQVTVLFADIKGSMELIAELDPEEAQKLLDPVLDRMIEAVYHFEGTVNRVMGDGIMALFGAPLAHEDHALRACYASLRMQANIREYAAEVQRSHGVPVAIRVGLNSGEILIAAIGNDLYMDYTVVGQTVHLAHRMEQMAKEGSVLTTADTIRMVEGYIVAEPLGPMPVKGLAHPVEVYEVISGGPARTRLQAIAWRGVTRFVGRDAEIGQLRQALTFGKSEQAQVVAVIGEPGVGKSRLVQEFVHSANTVACLILETNSASYTRSTPYLPVTELLRHYFQINIRDSTRSIQEKVTNRLLHPDPSLQDTIPPLLDLLDALAADHPFQNLDPLQHRQHTYHAVTRLLLAEALVQPLVLVFEDLHWYDTLTLGLLNELVVSARTARLLLFVSYRPEFRDQWKGRPNYRQLRLDPLANQNLSDLLVSLLGTDAGLLPLKNFLARRARGNPFFVEEIVRSLIDTATLTGSPGSYRLARPFSESDVPATVQAVLAARIDALAPDEKRLVQEAAVVGHDVPFGLLQAISGIAAHKIRSLLSSLEEAEFIYPTQLFPDLQYSFKHALTHDVVYAGMLHDRRREIHGRIVDAIEKLYADRIGEQVERLADHAVRGQLQEKAVTYLRQAGTKAGDREAYREAVQLFEQALAALAQLPESRNTLELAIDIRFDLRNVLQPLGDRERISDYLREAEALAERLGDIRRIGWVQSYYTEQAWMFGRYAESIAAGERALSIAEEISDLPLQVVTNLPLGLAHHTRGDYHRAMKCFGWNADHLQGELARERFGMFVLPSAFARSFIAWCLADLGRFQEGYAIGQEALQIAEAAKHPFSCGYAHLGLGVLSLRQGEVRLALGSFERGLAAGAFADSPVGFAYVSLHLGYALALSGRVDEGISILEQSVKVAESKGFVARHSLRLCYLGEAYLIAGRHQEAAEVGERAVALAREHEERANEAYALRVLGMLARRRSAPDQAAACFREAIELSKQLGMLPLEVNCQRTIAEIIEPGRETTDTLAYRATATASIQAMQLRFWDADIADTFDHI